MNSRRVLTISLFLGAMLSGSASGQPPVACNGTSCTVAGSIADDVTFEAGNTYLLHGQVVVEEPAVARVASSAALSAAGKARPALPPRRSTLTVYNLHAHKRADVDNLDTNTTSNRDIYTGFELSFNARFPGGGNLFGGIDFGRRSGWSK